MTEPTRIRALLKGDKVEVRMRIAHDMESGQRKDPKGVLVPAWHVTQVNVTHVGGAGSRTVFAAQWGTSVSKNPLVGFRFSGGKVGEKIVVSWVDNRGEKRSDEGLIQAS